MVRSLALCPDDAKQDPVVYGAEFRHVLGEGSAYCIHTAWTRLPWPLHSGLEGKLHFRLTAEFT